MRLLAFFKREAVLTVAALCALATMVLVPLICDATDLPVRRRLFSFFFVLIIGQIHTVEQLHILALFCHICSSLYLSNLRAP